MKGSESAVGRREEVTLFGRILPISRRGRKGAQKLREVLPHIGGRNLLGSGYECNFVHTVVLGETNENRRAKGKKNLYVKLGTEGCIVPLTVLAPKTPIGF